MFPLDWTPPQQRARSHSSVHAPRTACTLNGRGSRELKPLRMSCPGPRWRLQPAAGRRKDARQDVAARWISQLNAMGVDLPLATGWPTCCSAGSEPSRSERVLKLSLTGPLCEEGSIVFFYDGFAPAYVCPFIPLHVLRRSHSPATRLTSCI